MAKSIQFINQFDAHKLKNLITISYKFRIIDVHKLNNLRTKSYKFQKLWPNQYNLSMNYKTNQSSELINTHST